VTGCRDAAKISKMQRQLASGDDVKKSWKGKSNETSGGRRQPGRRLLPPSSGGGQWKMGSNYGGRPAREGGIPQKLNFGKNAGYALNGRSQD